MSFGYSFSTTSLVIDHWNIGVCIERWFDWGPHTLSMNLSRTDLQFRKDHRKMSSQNHCARSKTWEVKERKYKSSIENHDYVSFDTGWSQKLSHFATFDCLMVSYGKSFGVRPVCMFDEFHWRSTSNPKCHLTFSKKNWMSNNIYIFF